MRTPDGSVGACRLQIGWCPFVHSTSATAARCPKRHVVFVVKPGCRLWYAHLVSPQGDSGPALLSQVAAGPFFVSVSGDVTTAAASEARNACSCWQTCAPRRSALSGFARSGSPAAGSPAAGSPTRGSAGRTAWPCHPADQSQRMVLRRHIMQGPGEPGSPSRTWSARTRCLAAPPRSGPRSAAAASRLVATDQANRSTDRLSRGPHRCDPRCDSALATRLARQSPVAPAASWRRRAPVTARPAAVPRSVSGRT